MGVAATLPELSEWTLHMCSWGGGGGVAGEMVQHQAHLLTRPSATVTTKHLGGNQVQRLIK